MRKLSQLFCAALLSLGSLMFLAPLPAQAAKPAKSAKTATNIVCTPVGAKKPADQVGPVVMSQMPIVHVLDLLRDFSGRVVIPGEGITGTKLNFNSGGKLSRTDAIFALENLLAMNGVTLRELENGMIRAVPSTHSHRGAPPMVEAIPDDADSQQIYTKVFKLEYFDSGTAWHRVRNLITAGNRAAVENQPEINSLIVTDSLSNLKRVEEVVKLLDQPPTSRLELYTFPVVHSSPWHIRGLYYQIYNTSLNQRLRGSLVYADSRSQKLVVVTHPTNYEFFENLIKELDKEVAPFTTTEIIKIKEGNYWNIWKILHGIVRHQQSQFARRGFTSPEERDLGDSGVNRMTSEGQLSTVTDGEAPAEAQQSLPAAEVAGVDADPNAVMDESGSPELQFSPYIGLYADPSNHAFVIYGTKADIARARGLVDKLDIKSPPYVTSEVFTIKHAQATDIRNVLNYTISVQRRAFGRAGIQSGEERAQSTPSPSQRPDNMEQGFEYSSFVAVISDNRNNTLLVQGTQQDINQVRDLVTKLDVESAPLTSNEVIYIEHAQASTIAGFIQHIINVQRWAFSRSRNYSQANTQMEAPEINFEFSPYANIIADRRTNAIFVYGTQQDIVRVRKMVADADIPVEPMTDTKVFPLTHTDATQTASLINRIVYGQQRALRSVKSQSRAVNNPAAEMDAPPTMEGSSDGDESLQFSSFISVTPDRRSNSLIVYGTKSDIRQIEALVSQVDIEVAPLTTSQVFLLENTQARTMYGVLNSVVRGQERALRSVRSRIQQIRNVRGEDEESANAEMTLESLQFSPYVTITPNDRNNSIIVYGTNSDIEQLASLIEVSDVKIAPKTQSRTYFIRHADANDVARTITNLIRQQQRVRERERTLTRVFRRGEDGQIEGEEFAPGGDPSMDGGDMGGDMISEISTTNLDSIYDYDEDLQFSPYVSIVADDRSNSVLAYGTQFDLEQVDKLIQQIDDVLPQVRIEVVIAEVILTDDQVSGLDSFGVSYNTTVANQTDITTGVPGIGDGSEGAFDLGVSLNDFSIDTVFRVAKENKFVKVLSAPSVTTTHNKLATLNVGETRPIITSSSSNIDSNDLVTRSTVEYRDIGITLRVRPLVSSEGFIQMELEQVVETVIDTQLIDNNEQPIIGTRRASSFVSVRDQEVIILGGLQQVTTSDSDGSVFILGDLPIFGPIFQPKSKNQTVRELLLFIKPHLVESFEESELLTEAEMDRTTISKDVDHYLAEGRFREQEEIVKAQEAVEAEAAAKEAEKAAKEAEKAAKKAEKEAKKAAKNEEPVEAPEQASSSSAGGLDNDGLIPAVRAPEPPAAETPAPSTPATEGTE